MTRRFSSSLSDMQTRYPMLLPDGGRLYSARNSVCGGSIHSGRSSLCASSARSSISISGRSGSLSGRSQSRSSSVSIRLPLTYTPTSFPEHVLQPSRESRQSRLSLTSAWESIRGSVLSFSKVSKVFLVAPCSRHRCCLGCVSLRDAVPLICVAELVVLALLTLVAVDIYVTNGKLFYTNEMEGHGTVVAIACMVFILISIPVIVVTISSWHYHRRQLYLVHIIWQWTVLELLIYFAYSILRRVFSEEERTRVNFLLPSAVVLATTAVISVLVQCWWLFVFIDAMFYEHIVTERRASASSSNSHKRGPMFKVQNNIETDSIGTIESRRHSFAIPIVKLRKASEDAEHQRRSIDTESLPGLRLSSVMEGIPENHNDEIADV